LTQYVKEKLFSFNDKNYFSSAESDACSHEFLKNNNPFLDIILLSSDLQLARVKKSLLAVIQLNCNLIGSF